MRMICSLAGAVGTIAMEVSLVPLDMYLYPLALTILHDVVA